MKKEKAKEILRKHNEWRRGAEIEQLETISLKEAYEILKQNVRYSSGTCPGFVYLSQIEELLR